LNRLVGVGKVDPDGRGELVEEPVPGSPAGQRKLGDDPLLRRAQQMRAVAALHPQMVGAELEPFRSQ
jgi:hypothetical protein